MRTSRLFEQVIREAEVSYEDVVAMTGDDTEGDNVVDAYCDGKISFDDAVRILSEELKTMSASDAEDWLDTVAYDKKVDEEELEARSLYDDYDDADDQF